MLKVIAFPNIAYSSLDLPECNIDILYIVFNIDSCACKLIDGNELLHFVVLEVRNMCCTLLYTCELINVIITSIPGKSPTAVMVMNKYSVHCTWCHCEAPMLLICSKASYLCPHL